MWEKVIDAVVVIITEIAKEMIKKQEWYDFDSN